MTKELLCVDPEVPTERTARRTEKEPQTKPHDTLPGPDAHAATRNAPERLATTPAGDPARGTAHHELEGLPEQQERALLRQLMQHLTSTTPTHIRQ
ncbi:hypothetical protein [Streptomyces sp. NBC_01451]|uniref:hypothetical protein n=1 Tax=Streptomyces sp. NBC_01451 TaxID=2903872 RepID=UPI002E31EC8B|nr:hypothetical protein [Streptomyces sp. NBC_01451]